MERRSTDVRGCVNFPVTDTRFSQTGEGGMFVRLVIEDKAVGEDETWMVCCGGQNHTVYDESYLRDDQAPRPCSGEDLATQEDFERQVKANEVYEEQDFPCINEPEGKVLHSRYVSVPYLAVLTIGSTGWSGWSEESGAYWHCTYGDLTPAGKGLYDSLVQLYQGCSVRLQTWLDT